MFNMTPSKENVVMSDGQIDKAADALRAAFASRLRKHRNKFKAGAVQQALGTKELIPDMFAVFRGYVERFSNMIVRLVRPDWKPSPQAMLDDLGRKQYTDADVVSNMPRGKGKEVRVVFFQPRKKAYGENGLISDEKLEEEFAFHRLKPADPYSLARANKDDPDFADKHPNATHWKAKDGNWCYAAFYRWRGDERSVLVVRSDAAWYDNWWFAGLASGPES